MVLYARSSVRLHDIRGVGGDGSEGIHTRNPAVAGMHGTLYPVLFSAGGNRRKMVLYGDLRKQETAEHRD